MSKSSIYSVKGKAKWAKLFEFNKDNGDFHKETEGAYTIDVYLDQEELNTVSSSGSRVKPKITEDGVFVKFKRPHLPRSGIEALGGAPKVVDANDDPWDSEVAIGNDSEVEVFFSVYESKFGKGTRLEGVRVLDLVEYDSEGAGASSLPF